jgi:hypothetical protein
MINLTRTRFASREHLDFARGEFVILGRPSTPAEGAGIRR